MEVTVTLCTSLWTLILILGALHSDCLFKHLTSHLECKCLSKGGLSVSLVIDEELLSNGG